MGTMRESTCKRDLGSSQDEFVALVNSEMSSKNITVGALAVIMEADRSQASRSVAGIRKFTYEEVVKISHYLKIRPESWDSIGNTPAYSGFLPLYGSIATSVWRVKGTPMSEVTSPIRAVDTGDGVPKKQFCFYVNEGSYSGEYAVCIDADSVDFINEDILVVEETRLLPPKNTEISRLTLRSVQLLREGAFKLACLNDTTPGGILHYPGAGIEIKGLVIGFFRKIREKKP